MKVKVVGRHKGLGFSRKNPDQTAICRGKLE
jgi:hypothetical protein